MDQGLTVLPDFVCHLIRTSYLVSGSRSSMMPTLSMNRFARLDWVTPPPMKLSRDADPRYSRTKRPSSPARLSVGKRSVGVSFQVNVKVLV